MNRHKIGTVAGGMAGLQFVSDIISTCEEPKSDPVSFEQIGTDLNGMPIEAGFGSAVWNFSVMPQADYDYLLELQGNTPAATMIVHTAKKSGASGIDFANYTAVVGRPTFARRVGLLCYDVTIPLTNLVPI